MKVSSILSRILHGTMAVALPLPWVQALVRAPLFTLSSTPPLAPLQAFCHRRSCFQKGLGA